MAGEALIRIKDADCDAAVGIASRVFVMEGAAYLQKRLAERLDSSAGGIYYRRMLRISVRPCLPSPAKRPPSGDQWLHEIKHDGMRIMARRDKAGVRLITRHGNDFTSRFPLIVEAVGMLPSRWFLIDGEAICTNGDGFAMFDLIRRQRNAKTAVMVAFDVIELDGEDLRRWPLEHRKRKLAKLVTAAQHHTE
jgi:ATP-dependent DNA ligase